MACGYIASAQETMERWRRGNADYLDHGAVHGRMSEGGNGGIITRMNEDHMFGNKTNKKTTRVRKESALSRV